jgi:hypothetical protein
LRCPAFKVFVGVQSKKKIMATLGTFVNRFVGVRELADAPSAVWTRTESPRLRPLANEDVYLFVKRIDNGSVVRVVDPAARRARSNTMATGFIAAMLVIAGLVPTAYNIMSGFTLQHLHAEQARLQEDRARLDASEAALLSDDHMRALAKSLKMTEPLPQQIQTLDGVSVVDKSAVASVAAENTLPFSPSNGVAAR